jgi:type IV pilus assembly protein PilA
MRTPRDNDGFTLIELMVVVAIIAVLAAIAYPQYASYRIKAMNAAAKASLHQLAKAQEDYYLATDTYTQNRASISGLAGWTVEDSVTVTILAASTQSWSATASHNSSAIAFTYSSSTGGLSN